MGIDSDNGFSPVRCQVIIWTNAGLMLTGPLGTYLSEIVIKAIFIQENALKMSSAKRKPFYPGLNVLTLKPQWVKYQRWRSETENYFGETSLAVRRLDEWGPFYWHGLALITACRRCGAKSLSEQMHAGLILTGPLATYLSEIVIKVIFIQEKALKMSSAKRKPFYPGLNVLTIIM